MTINDVREIYAAHGFYHAEESIQQADLPPEQERELKEELWRLHEADASADGGASVASE
jgi:hypothetical protein